MDYSAVKTLLSSLEGEEHLEYETILVYSTGLSIDALIYDFDYYVSNAPSRIARPRPIPLDPAIHAAVLKSFDYFKHPQIEEEEQIEDREPEYLHAPAVEREADPQHLQQISLSQPSADLSLHIAQDEILDVEQAQAPTSFEPALKPSGTYQQDKEPEGFNTKSENADALMISVLHSVMRNDSLPSHSLYKTAVAKRFPSFAFPDHFGICDDDDLTHEELNVRRKCRRYRFCGSELDNAICNHFLKYRPYLQDLKHYFRPDFEDSGNLSEVLKRQHQHFLAFRRSIRKRDREYVKIARKQSVQRRENAALEERRKLARTSPVRPNFSQLRRSKRLCKFP